MKKNLILNKKVGQTPLECVELFRDNNAEYQNAKFAYAGRLDPMAEGQLLVLVGEECKKRDHYLNLDKEYEFEILLGFGTDTQDILGIIENVNPLVVDISNLESVLCSMQGKQSLQYPAYSSKTVQGKPLFLWALEGRIDEIERPSKEVSIYRLENTGSYTLSSSEVKKYVHNRIARVTPVTDSSKSLGNDFRRVEVLEKWDDYLETRCPRDQDFKVLQIRCVCSSGTYMRTLAHMIGQELGTSGLAWSIKRTKIGTYKKLWGPIGIWTKQYN